MSKEIVKCNILTNKAVQLLSSIADIYGTNNTSPSTITLEDSPRTSNLSEEKIIFKTHVTWVIKIWQLEEKQPGKYIESASVDVSSPDISYLWFRLYPKGKNSNPQFLEFSVHFKYLPENVHILCEMALVDHFKDVFLKNTFSDNSGAVKENRIDFLNFCPSSTIKLKQMEGKLMEKLFVQCRIKVISKIYTCVSEKLTYTVKMTPEVSNLNSDILKNGKYSDVTLLAESKQIKSNKFILASESPSLHILMKVNPRDTLELDEKYCILQNLLKYMYTGNFRIFNFSDSVDYYISSCKYEVLDLKDLCKTYLIASLTEKNVSYVWDLSRSHGDEYLLNACMAFLKSNNVDLGPFLKRHF